MDLTKRNGSAAFARRRSIAGAARFPGSGVIGAMGAPLGLLWCRGRTSTPPPPQTFSISGTISPVRGGVVRPDVKRSRQAPRRPPTAQAISALVDYQRNVYDYSKPCGYTFSPTSLSVTVSGANITTGLNFTATVQGGTHSISGNDCR